MLSVLHAHSGNLFGGIERILTTLVSHPRGGVQHAFALAFPGRLASTLTHAGAPPAMVGAARVSRPWTVWEVRRRLGDVIRQRRPEVAVVHSAWALTVFGPAIGRAGIPLVLWLHDRPGSGWLDRRARRAGPAHILCNSRYTEGLARTWYGGVPTEVVYPPVPPPASAAGGARIRRELGLVASEPLIVQVGRLEALKGHRVLLEALGGLGDHGWAYAVVGGAQRPTEVRYRRDLEAAARHLGIGERVHFLGERTDIPDILDAADIFCQPNVEPETFGIAIVEALYAGLPVVTSALGGAREIVTDAVGVQVPAGEPAALRAALLGLLADPDRRQRVATHGPARARDVAQPERQIDRLHDVLRRVVPEKAT